MQISPDTNRKLCEIRSALDPEYSGINSRAHYNVLSDEKWGFIMPYWWEIIVTDEKKYLEFLLRYM